MKLLPWLRLTRRETLIGIKLSLPWPFQGRKHKPKPAQPPTPPRKP